VLGTGVINTRFRLTYNCQVIFKLDPHAKMSTSGTASAMAAPTTFTRFPDLPTELRLKVWRLSMRFPRLITFRPQKPPAVFSVCRESRHETRQKYFPQWLYLHPKKCVFINFEFDTVYLCHSAVQGDLNRLLRSHRMYHRGTMTQVRSLMIPFPIRMSYDYLNGLEMWVLKSVYSATITSKC
jgi:hypothetical protein